LAGVLESVLIRWDVLYGSGAQVLVAAQGIAVSLVRRLDRVSPSIGHRWPKEPLEGETLSRRLEVLPHGRRYKNRTLRRAKMWPWRYRLFARLYQARSAGVIRMLTISMGMNIFPLYHDPGRTLAQLRSIGFGGVDFNYTDYASSPELMTSRFDRWTDALGTAAEKNRIRIFQAHAPCLAPWHSAEERQLLHGLTRHCLAASGRLGVQWVVFHALPQPDFLGGPAQNSLLCANADYFRSILDLMPDGPGIAVENGSGELTRTAEELLGLVDRVGSERFGVCWDTGHAHLDGVDQDVEIAALGATLKCLHVQDNDGVSDQHLLPFAVRGGIKWQAVTRGLQRAAYRGAFNYEVHNAFHDRPPESIPVILKHAHAVARVILEPLMADGQGE